MVLDLKELENNWSEVGHLENDDYVHIPDEFGDARLFVKDLEGRDWNGKKYNYKKFAAVDYNGKIWEWCDHLWSPVIPDDVKKKAIEKINSLVSAASESLTEAHELAEELGITTKFLVSAEFQGNFEANGVHDDMTSGWDTSWC